MKHTLDDRLEELQKRLGGVNSPDGGIINAVRYELDRLKRADDSADLLDKMDAYEGNVIVTIDDATRSRRALVCFRGMSTWHVKPTAREALREALDELKEFKK